jgi:hypothetical protein
VRATTYSLKTMVRYIPVRGPGRARAYIDGHELGHTEGTPGGVDVPARERARREGTPDQRLRAWALRDSNPRLPPCKSGSGARDVPGHSLDVGSDLPRRLSLFVVVAQRFSTFHGLGTDLRRPIRRMRLHPNRPSPGRLGRGAGPGGCLVLGRRGDGPRLVL